MKLLTCIAALAMLALTTPAAAQSAWGRLQDGSLGRTFPGSLGISSDWDRCTNSNRVYDAQISIESCTSLIATNDARSWFGPLYWHRALRNLAAGNQEQYSNDLARAEEYFSIEIRANPREYWGYSNRAAVQTRLGHFDNALADYERAATLSRDVIAPHMGMASVYFRQGEFRAALEALDLAGRTAARVGRTWPSLHAARCEVRAALQIELDRALRFCNRAVRNADTPSYALTSRGYFHFMAGDLPAAAADFTSAIEEDPYNAAALYARGVVAVRQGNVAEGEADMARAREMDEFRVAYYANAGLTP